MRRIGVLVALLLVSARGANASSLTFENLWPYDATAVILWNTTSTAWVSADYGSRTQGVDIIDLPLTEAHPLRAYTSQTVEIPSGRFDTGFFFGSLDMGGPCPQNCGWGSSQTDTAFGTWIDGTVPINLLWPTTDPTFMASIMRVTFAPSVGLGETGAMIKTVPEPASLLLLVTAGALGLREARKRRQLARTRG